MNILALEKEVNATAKPELGLQTGSSDTSDEERKEQNRKCHRPNIGVGFNTFERDHFQKCET